MQTRPLRRRSCTQAMRPQNSQPSKVKPSPLTLARRLGDLRAPVVLLQSPQAPRRQVSREVRCLWRTTSPLLGVVSGVDAKAKQQATSSQCHPLACLWQNRKNNTLTKALVFHQILSTPKASYSGRYPSDTPQGRTRKIHIFPHGSNNENELQYLIHFVHPEFLEIHYYIAKCQSAEY